MTNSPKYEEGPVQLQKGQMVGGNWRVVKKLGEGGCGAVYMVEHAESKQIAALKAESNFVEGGSVLKIEVNILSRLKGRKHVPELLYAAKKSKYQYIVMSLLGESLNTLLKRCGKQCSFSTTLRVGINVLFGIKQIHDVVREKNALVQSGFVHRDLKPANLAAGKLGSTDPNIIYILDFGLSREFVEADADGAYKMRKPRKRVLFRGTTRYCSVSVHSKNEQGRPDDLWSLLYVLVELRGRLPWSSLKDKEELKQSKINTSDADLLAKCPQQLMQFVAHLRTLDYWKRPDYLLLYNCLMEAMQDGGYRFSDPWDWDRGAPTTLRSKLSKVLSNDSKQREAAEKSMADDDCNPFSEDDFASSPLGF